MKREEQEASFRWAFSERRIAFLFHGHVEAAMEGVTAQQLAGAAQGYEVLEEYPERPQGLSKLLLAYLDEEDPLHVVVNVAAFESDPAEPLRVVTVYRPEPPKWRDERTRGVR